MSADKWAARKAGGDKANKVLGLDPSKDAWGKPVEGGDISKRPGTTKDVAKAATQKADAATRTASTPSEHKAAGEAHLEAAEAGKALPGTDAATTTGRHLRAAAEHAKVAGGAWDDAKHPRDAKGKFR